MPEPNPFMAHTIAIDGPAASGKSSAAEIVARRLGFSRLDSGLIYRAITYIISRDGHEPALDSEETRQRVKGLRIEMKGGKIYYEGANITQHLRTPAIDRQVGMVAKELYVREKTHELQHEIITNSGTGVVVDGRDIGTVVLPDAFLKVFITAKDTTRAKRRAEQTGCSYDEVLDDIRKRDHHDITRKHGPLKVADDAIVLENDEMTLDETVDKVVALFEERKKRAN